MALACHETLHERARDLLDLHGLHDWTFRLNRRRRCLGVCRYGTRSVELSRYFVERNSPEEVQDTLLHEIAHALVGPGHGHDAVWTQKCLELGARPERRSAADMPRGRWQGECGSCSRRFHRFRRPRRAEGWYCRSCGPQRGLFSWSFC